MSECFFWYQLTRIVPDNESYNGCCFIFVKCPPTLLLSLCEGQIDETLDAFTKLKTLKLSRNNLIYVGELESCFNLWYLDLSNNYVSFAAEFFTAFIVVIYLS